MIALNYRVSRCARDNKKISCYLKGFIGYTQKPGETINVVRVIIHVVLHQAAVDRYKGILTTYHI